MTEPVNAYHVRVAPAVRRGLHRLPRKIAPAIIAFITGPLADNPHRLSKPLVNELTGYRTARRGEYRVLLTIDDGAHEILIADVDHRASIYRQR